MDKLIAVLLMLVSVNVFAGSSWECVGRMITCHTWRMAVPQGWIVSGDNSAGGGEHGYAMTYVPDENHEWKI